MAQAAKAAISAKYAELGGAGGVLGAAKTDVVPDAASGTFRVDYEHGGIYFAPPIGAHAVYGEIYKKWIAAGGLGAVVGYPTTDEGSTPDNKARYNIFKSGAIYWSSTTGAHLVYGEIWKKYVTLGRENSFLGIPVTDELPAGKHGGRYNDFSGGFIYWSPSSGAYEHKGGLGDQLYFTFTRKIDENFVAAEGTFEMWFSRNGDVRFKVHFHDSGAADYTYSVALVMVDADNQVYTLSHSGKIEAHKDNDYDATKRNPAVADGWRAMVVKQQ